MVFLSFPVLVAMISSINRNTQSRITEVKGHLKSFGEGDFSTPIEPHGHDELSEMLADMEQLQCQMSTTLSQISETIDQAREGNLRECIAMDHKHGVYAELSDGINERLKISEIVINDTSRMFHAMSHGDLSERIHNDYIGAFDKLKQDANGMAEALNSIIHVEITRLFDNAVAGNLHHRLAINSKEGFFADLGRDVNALLEAIDQLLEDLSRSLKHMAEGDLQKPIARAYLGIFDELKNSTNHCMQITGETIRQL